MTLFETLRPALTGLLAASLMVAAADALFGDHADGLRLACGLSLVLCLARVVHDALLL